MMKIGFYVSGNPIGAEAIIYQSFWLRAIKLSSKRSLLATIRKAERVRIDIKYYFATKRHVDLDNIQKLVWDALGDCQGERLGDDKRFYGSINFEYRHEPGLQITVTW